LALPLQPAAAQNKLDVLNKGVRVGEPLPHPLTVADQFNDVRDFASLKREKGLILLFSRSFDWWPFCIIQAVAWIDEFHTLGYEVATVTYDSQPTLARFAKRRKMNYPVLADPGSQVIRAFGLLNEDYPTGSYAHGVAHPIIIVFNEDGIVTHRFSRAGYVRRPDVGLVLNELRKSTAGYDPSSEHANGDAAAAKTSMVSNILRRLENILIAN
jgi:peroxiredoxin